MSWKLYVTEHADKDIDDIWDYGNDKFGLKIAEEYDKLINQALNDLGDNPYRTGSKLVPDRDDELYSYKLSFSKSRADTDIKSPSHAVFYFTVKEEAVVVTTVSRESRERHIDEVDRSVTQKEYEDWSQEVSYFDQDLDKDSDLER